MYICCNLDKIKFLKVSIQLLLSVTKGYKLQNYYGLYKHEYKLLETG